LSPIEISKSRRPRSTEHICPPVNSLISHAPSDDRKVNSTTSSNEYLPLTVTDCMAEAAFEIQQTQTVDSNTTIYTEVNVRFIYTT